MSRLPGVLGIVAVLLAVMVFARLNGGEVATVNVGVATFQNVPITFVLFAGLVLGMLVMLLAGLHADLKVRRLLRERLAEEERGRPERRQPVEEPRVDPFQHPDEGRDDRPEDVAVSDRE